MFGGDRVRKDIHTLVDDVWCCVVNERLHVAESLLPLAYFSGKTIIVLVWIPAVAKIHTNTQVPWHSNPSFFKGLSD